MTEPNDSPSEQPPLARVTPRRFSFVWLVPVIALLGLTALVIHQTNQERGPIVTISFTDADGVEAGAEIRHRGITVGVVRTVTLTESLDAVRVTAELRPDARNLASPGTRFWVVRPELSLSRVAGLETLLGPRYIAAQPADGAGETGVRTTAFTGLDTPPLLTGDADSDALLIALSAPRVGPLTIGSPVLYRDIPVGIVRTVTLADDASSVRIGAAIDPAYATLVRTNSRFWIASGVGLDWGLFRGLSLKADSLDSLIQGAIGFATPNKPGERVGPGHAFRVAAESESDWLRWSPTIMLRDRP